MNWPFLLLPVVIIEAIIIYFMRGAIVQRDHDMDAAAVIFQRSSAVEYHPDLAAFRESQGDRP